jgi:hypothetical protein
MSSHGELIDRIVREVLSQLSDRAETVRANGSDNSQAQTIISERVVTAELLTERVNGAATVIVGPKAVVTPSAWDLARSRNLTIQRDSARPANDVATSVVHAIVVNSTAAIERVAGDSTITWQSTDCPDAAAEIAADAVVRGGHAAVVIFAAWSHRVAMLANRHDKVRAAAIENASQVWAVTKQMRPNVWCVDPRPLSYFELRNLISAIQKT